MEHRQDLRVPVKLNVNLFRKGQKFDNYQSANLGYGGLFLTACYDVVDEGDFIVATIDDDSGATAGQYPMKAMVVHSTGSGIGLMWTDCSVEFYDALSQLIKRAA